MHHSDDPGLLVVFSSIGEEIHLPDMTRFFNQSFKTISKFIPKDIGILRIADLGGVVGAFYMNTNYQSNNEFLVSEFLASSMKNKNIRPDRTVFYGASKGGTGALLHGIKLGVKVATVDPIVSDHHYLLNMGDVHFSGTLLERKEVRFKRLFREVAISNTLCVITSGSSPQFKYIHETIPRNEHVMFFDSYNPNIFDHPDVGPNTINSLTMLINMCFYDINLFRVEKRIL